MINFQMMICSLVGHRCPDDIPGARLDLGMQPKLVIVNLIGHVEPTAVEVYLSRCDRCNSVVGIDFGSVTDEEVEDERDSTKN